MLLLTSALIVSLTGCAKGVSEPCPSLVEYDRAEQAQAADELAALPEGSALARLTGDYAAVRAEIRACRN
jgi:hypothetical protein